MSNVPSKLHVCIAYWNLPRSNLKIQRTTLPAAICAVASVGYLGLVSVLKRGLVPFRTQPATANAISTPYSSNIGPAAAPAAIRLKINRSCRPDTQYQCPMTISET